MHQSSDLFQLCKPSRLGNCRRLGHVVQRFQAKTAGPVDRAHHFIDRAKHPDTILRRTSTTAGALAVSSEKLENHLRASAVKSFLHKWSRVFHANTRSSFNRFGRIAVVFLSGESAASTSTRPFCITLDSVRCARLRPLHEAIYRPAVDCPLLELIDESHQECKGILAHYQEE